jgi:hypothetical protein
MAGMVFSAKADFDELENLKQKITEIRKELSGMDIKSDAKGASGLMKELQRLQEEYRKQSEAAQIAMKQLEQLQQKYNAQGSTIAQLEKHIQSLNAQLREGSKGIDSPEYTALEKRLREVEKAYDALIDKQRQTVTDIQAGAQQIAGSAGIFDRLPQSLKQMFSDTGASQAAFVEKINEQKAVLKSLELQLMEVRQKMMDANKLSPMSEAAVQKTEQARKAFIDVRNELADQKKIVRELEAAYNKLFGDTTEKTVKIRTEIMNLTNEITRMQKQGVTTPQEIARLDELKRKLSELGTAYNAVLKEKKLLTTGGNMQMAGIISGMSGVAGAFTAAQGAMSLFAEKNEDLMRIQMKLQSAMSITMGLQAVSNTLHQTSAFRLATVAKLQEWWAAVTAKTNAALLASTAAGRAAAAADDRLAAAHARLAAATAIVERQEAKRGTASVAAYARLSAAQHGLSKAQTAHAAAMSAQAAAAGTATVANKGLAGSFKLIGTAIKSIPGWGWLLALTGALAAVVAIISSAAGKAKKEMEEFNKKVAESVSKPIVAINRLSLEWTKLGDNMKAKEKFIDDSQEKFKDLGLAINSVAEAEKLLVDNREAFIEAQILKAKALASINVAEDKYRAALSKLWNTPKTRRVVKSSVNGAPSGYEEIPNYEYIKAEKELDEAAALMGKLIKEAVGFSEEEQKILAQIGQSANNITEGSIEALNKNIDRLKKRYESAKTDLERSELSKEIQVQEELLKKIDIYSSQKKDGSAENKAKREAQKRIDAGLKLEEQERKIENGKIRFKNDIAKKTLEIEKDSFDKRMKQNDLNYEIEKQRIREREESLLKELQDAERSKWEEGGSKGLFEPSITKLPDDMAKEIAKEYEVAESARRAGELKIQEELGEMWNEEVLRFSVSLEKQLYEADRYYRERIALAKENSKLIAKLEENREREKERIRNGDFIRRAKTGAKYGDLLGVKDITEKELKLVKRFFGDIEKIGMKSIKTTKEQLNAVFSYARGELAVLPEDLRKLFGTLNDGTEESAERLKELADLFEKLDGQEKKMAKKTVFKAMKESFKDFIKAVDGSEAQLNALNDLLSGFEVLSSAFNQAGEAMKEMGITAGEVVTDIGGIISSTVEMATAGGKMGGTWGAVVGAVLGLASSLIPVLAKTQGLSGETVHYYDSLIEVTDILIDRQLELARVTTGATAAAAAAYAQLLEDRRLLYEQERWEANFLDPGQGHDGHSRRYWTTANFRDKAYEAVYEEVKKNGSLFGKVASPSWLRDLSDEALGDILNRLSPDVVAAAFGLSEEQLNYLKEQGADLVKFLTDTNQYIKDLTPEQALAIMNMPELWSLFDEETQQYMTSLINHADEMKRIAKEVREAITGITFEDLSGSLASLVADSELTFEKIGKSFEDILSKSILAFIKKKYLIDKLEEWHKMLEAAWEDGVLTDEEAEALRKQYEETATEGNRRYKETVERLGIDTSDSEASENTLKGAYAKASQESIDLLGGQTGALRRTVEEIRAILNERYVLPPGFIESVMGGMGAIPELIAGGLHEVIAIKELSMRIAASNDAVAANTERIGDISLRVEAIGRSVDGKLDALAEIADHTASVGDISGAASSAAGSLRSMERNVNVKFKGL